MSRTPFLVCLAAALAAGCVSASVEGVLDEEDICPARTAALNYGCTRIVTLVEGPAPETWPTASRIDIRAYPARPNSGQGTSSSRSPWLVSSQIEITASLSPVMPQGVDTLSMWVISRIIDDSRPVLPGVELNLFAVDSVKTIVKFAQQGQRRYVDTVRLSMKKVKQ